MKIAVIAFSECGAKLAGRFTALSGHEIKGYVIRRHSEGTNFEPFESVYELTARLFNAVDAFVFVGACGIAVRAVAPLVRSKLTDPAVAVCDETGRFAVSLLSGHAGGANNLTEQIAALIGATPVITTASDSYAALDGQAYGTAKPYLKPLLSKNLVLGIGCRRGLSAETIERSVTVMLWDRKIPLNRVCETATIDVKRGESGLLAFAKAHKLPLNFYSAQELANVKGEFSSSERVLKSVGVDNVCERAAVLCGGTGKLILRKTSKDGVTVSVFERD